MNDELIKFFAGVIGSLIGGGIGIAIGELVFYIQNKLEDK